MPVDQLSPPRAPRPAGDAKLVKYDQYIDTQIQITRRAVKAVDWATSLLQLVIGVLLFLLAAAVLDHWIVPSGFSVAMRTVLFVVLAGAVGYFAYRRLWPLCRRAINPIYAAQTIEQASPTLKNSLINLLLFRQHRAEIPDAVYQTLEEQAARRLTRVNVDTAVDRTALIRIGYVLLAVVGLAALYKLLSPKDPVIAAQRVLLPWSDIVPASRVSITAVTPGSVTVSRGEFVEVSAEVRGIDEVDAVLLRYTTDDGQAIDKPIEMKLSEDGPRFVGRLPEGKGVSQMGLVQNVRYHIEAGDARSLDYHVLVVPAPSILVQRVDYDYPDYTGFVDRKVDGIGDIRAIEGTRVTIHARANGPIKESHIDFDADGRSDLKMAGQDATARASFVLELREDRQTPRHASYVLRFTNLEGRSNREPVKYPITVDPDRSPEAAILRPEEKTRDVRLNDTITIEAEARDPDFGLAEVRLRGEVAGRTVIDEPLLAAPHTGRFTDRYQFTPSAQGLRAGDEVEYWVVARDIKSPNANTIESERKLLRITSPDPAKQPPPDRIAQADRRQQPNQQQRNQEKAERRDQQQQQPGDGQQQQGGEPQQGDQSGGDGQQSAEPNQKQGDKQTARQRDQGSSNGEPASAGGDQQRGEGDPSSNNKQTGAGAAGGESSQQGSQPDGTRPDDNNAARPSDGQRRDSGDQQLPNTEKSPVSAEGDNDAEAFKRIQQHLERKGDLQNDESATAPEDKQFSRDAQRSAEEKRQGDKETGRQGGKETSTQEEQQSAGGEPASAGGQKANERAEGTGADTKQDDLPEEQPQPRDRGDQTKSPGGQQTNTKGPSGAGDEQQSQGTPNAQPEMKPSEKRQRQQSGSEGEQTDQQEPPAGARGNKESDSHGEQGGDKAGGGEEGGGQKTPRDGTGSAGQNQSADEGAGESTEKGAGNNSPNAGQDATSDERTGQPGQEEPGSGSSQRDRKGTKPGGAERRPGESGEPASAGGEQQPNKGQQPSQDNKQPNPGAETPQNDQPPRHLKEQSDPTQRGGTATGQGGQTGTAGTASPSEGVVPDGDPANLEYARKQTDLVLDKLADQLKKKQVDKNLLEQLGWTQEDLQRFVARWQERKTAAERNDAAGEAARRELDDALRSLGLRRGPLKLAPVTDDRERDLRQGFRGPVPLEYQQRLRSYNEGVSRARQNGE